MVIMRAYRINPAGSRGEKDSILPDSILSQDAIVIAFHNPDRNVFGKKTWTEKLVSFLIPVLFDNNFPVTG